ncbi:hypothetical protein P2H57_08220 [Citrobacter freundii]|uniref:hypothetical protein n=1 Tax=Citrobacter TaxID=544 RepID=UPI000A413766|nr:MULTISPECIES: hypothetical protein [Citrobacter]MCQ7060376.1 hypothetical protein [Escherichia coli]MDK2359192.1 hypothetical protein [Citrobacter freundii]MDM2942043.1 hypothetical protein [Citrobacter sp. Cm038]
MPELKQSTVALAHFEIPLETARDGLRKAKGLGNTTFLNPAPTRNLRGIALSAVDNLTT